MPTHTQRWAVFVTGGDKCYMCDQPVDLASLEVDHILPESLAERPQDWAAALEQLGRSPDFEVNSYENWLAACRRCNGLKRDTVWEPSLLVQTYLQRAAARADKARTVERETQSKARVTRAAGLLLSVAENGKLTDEVREQLAPLVEALAAARPDLETGYVVRLTPDYQVPLFRVLSDDGTVATAQGAYGVGGGPSLARPGGVPAGMSCPVCGLPFFNGSRCVTCGAIDDGD